MILQGWVDLKKKTVLEKRI